MFCRCRHGDEDEDVNVELPLCSSIFLALPFRIVFVSVVAPISAGAAIQHDIEQSKEKRRRCAQGLVLSHMNLFLERRCLSDSQSKVLIVLAPHRILNPSFLAQVDRTACGFIKSGSKLLLAHKHWTKFSDAVDLPASRGLVDSMKDNWTTRQQPGQTQVPRHTELLSVTWMAWQRGLTYQTCAPWRQNPGCRCGK